MAAAAPPSDLPSDDGASYDPHRTRLRLAARGPGPDAAMVLPPGEAGGETIGHDTGALDVDGTLAAPPDIVPAGRGEDAEPGGAFRLESLIGSGGFGDVWSGLQVSLQRVVAVKRLRAHGRPAHEVRVLDDMFRIEALTTASLEHPNIVPVYDLGLDATGRPQLGMKLVRGASWHDLLRRERGQVPAAEYLARHLGILVQVAQAVAYAHARGIVHRDIKPAQVMVGEYGEVLLGDWGLAMTVGQPAPALAGRGGRSFTSQTATNPAGTPSFMAPEQTEPTAERIGVHTDVYLLGGTLYCILTGQAPHESGNGRQAFQRAAVGAVEPPESRISDGFAVPPELSRLAQKALAARPEDRLPSAADFVRGLQDYLSGASRHAEALRLADEARARLAGARAEYGVLSAAAHLADQARALWPDHADLVALREEVDRRFARAALDHQDLILARLHAERLGGAERDELLAEVARLEAQRVATHRQRRLALAAAATLALLLAGGAAQYARSQREAARALAEQRDAAEAARNRAEDLMTFMLEDLQGGLEDVGRLDLMEPVARRAEEYYRQGGPAGASPAASRKRALALQAIGGVLQGQGDVLAARRAFDDSIAILQAVTREQPADAAAWDSLMKSQYGSAFAAADQGEEAAALARYQELRAVAQARLEGGDQDARRWLNVAWDGLGIVHYDARRMPEALQAFEAAFAAVDTPGAPLAADATGPLYRAGIVLSEMGRGPEGLERLDRALAAIEAQAAAEPDKPALVQELAFARTARGLALQSMGRLAEAERDARQGLRSSLDHLALDPGNADVRFTAAQASLVVGDVRQQQGDAAGARAARQGAVDVLAPISKSPTVYFDDLRARALLLLGRVEEARPIVRKLQARGWKKPEFVALVAKAGLAP